MTHYELELMDVLWKKGEATVQDVCDALPRALAYTTVMTTLNHLYAKKKVLQRVKRGRAFVYLPKMSREEMSATVLEDLQPVLFGDALPSLVLGMLSRRRLSEADISALKAALRDVEERE